VLGVSNVWLPDRGADADCGTDEVELRPVPAAVSDSPVCDPPKALLDVLPIVPLDPVRGGDKLDAVDDPLRPAAGTEDGEPRPSVAVEPTCVSAELVDKRVPLISLLDNVF
jgi:hypothetical protein